MFSKTMLHQMRKFIVCNSISSPRKKMSLNCSNLQKYTESVSYSFGVKYFSLFMVIGSLRHPEA